ncbi:MAG: histidinol-phosphate transaminase [Actinomycetales bacterium]|nr:histidinol-phosphate transaminase [Actinomycetales bacterium]
MASRIPGPSALDDPEAQPVVEGRPGVRLRQALQELPSYVPGASGANASVFKLSSNEVPFPPLPAVISAIADTAEDANRYPEMYGDRLLRAIAAHHGISEDQVIIGNGSVALAELLVRSMCVEGDEVVYAWRSFEAYPILIQVTGALGVPVPLGEGGTHDLRAMAAAVTDRTRVMLVCSPNNPTSTAITQADLIGFLDSVPSDVMVVLDEAYTHFTRSADPIDSVPLLQTYKNIVILRTFSKAYGLAGLRVGYALARRRLIRGLRVASTPFGVSAVAQAAALAALRQQRQVDERVDAVVVERERVVSALRAQGWDLPDAQGNFYWLALGERSVAFANEAMESGIAVRPFAGDGVRVSVGESEANDIAIRLAERWAPSRAAGRANPSAGPVTSAPRGRT